MFLIELSASFCVPLWGVLLDFFDGVKDFFQRLLYDHALHQSEENWH